jgi:hypothetical protein
MYDPYRTSAGSNRADAVRRGEELPLATLAPYLFTELPHLREAFDKAAIAAATDNEIIVAQFGRGYSNLTYLIGVGDHEIVLRRPPLGANIATAHDMGREVRVLSGLAKVYAHVPRVLLYCQDTQIISRLRQTRRLCGAPSAGLDTALSSCADRPPARLRERHALAGRASAPRIRRGHHPQ